MATNFIVGEVVDLVPICGEPENYQGKVMVMGVPHHVQLVAVAGATQTAVMDPNARLADVRRLNDGPLATIAVPGLPGKYVMVIFPYGE